MGSIAGFYLMPHPPIVVPEVGKGEERKIQNTYDACMKIAEEIAQIKPDTIVIVTSHGVVFNDAVALAGEANIQGSLANFNAPSVEMNIDIDLELTHSIFKISYEQNAPSAEVDANLLKRFGRRYELDHGAMVPLYFVNQKYKDYKLVHTTFGMLSPMQHYKFGMAVKMAAEESDKKVVFIASGDLSHRLKEEGPYGYNEEGPRFDSKITELLQKGAVSDVFNLDCDMVGEAGECGLKSIYIMLGAMNGKEIKGNLLSYEGTFGVGYGVMRFELEDSNRDYLKEITEEKNKRYMQRIDNEDTYVRLARESLTYFILNGDYMKIPDYVTEEMKGSKRGVFVSIKEHDDLRGCIGTIYPVTGSIADEIIRNAVEAATQDPRFNPIEENELEDLVISVDVLTEPVGATAEELDPKKYGVIVRSGRKSALLLPDLEGLDTVEKQLNAVLEKGGIRSEEDYTIEKFEVIRHR